jgi:hypothetical protein
MVRDFGVDATYDRILAILRAAIRASGRTQVAVDQAIGRRRGYLSHVFQRRVEIKLRDVLKVLRILGLDPSLVLGPLVLKTPGPVARAEAEEPAGDEAVEEPLPRGEMESLIAAILDASPPPEAPPDGEPPAADPPPPS